jgi:hypothetical protein
VDVKQCWCVIDIASPYSSRSASSYGLARICRPAAEGENAAITAIKLATELYGPEVVVSQGASARKAVVRVHSADEESRVNCVRVRLVTLENATGKLRRQLAALAVCEAQDGEARKDRQIAALEEENAALLAQLRTVMDGALGRPGLPEGKPAPFWRGWRRKGGKGAPEPQLEE